MTDLCPKTINLLRCGGCQASVVWDALQSQILKKSDDEGVIITCNSNLKAALHHEEKMPRTIIWDDSDEEISHPNLKSLERVRVSSDLAAIIYSAVASYTDVADAETVNNLGEETATSTRIQSVVLSMRVYICHGSPSVRKSLVENLRFFFKPFENIGASLSFPTVVHPAAYISTCAKLGQGCFIGPGAIIHTNANIGDFCIVNTLSVIEHDCKIGDYCNLNPGAVVCGAVEIDADTTIGANATVRDHTSIAQGSVIGMQAGVVSSICTPKKVHIGLPCRVKNNVKEGDATRLLSGGENKMTSSVKKHQGDEFSSTATGTISNAKISWCLIKKFNPDRFNKYLLPSLTKGHLTNDGPLQRLISEKIKKFCGTQRTVLMTTNGTAALHVLATAWEIKLNKRLRWATQAFTFPSSIQGPLCDAIVLDMDDVLLGPSMKKLQELKDCIDGVVVTNIFGQVADCIAYENWCKQNGKILLLDNAATAIHFTQDKRSIHDFGDGAFISLHETKPLGRGEGGAIFIPPSLNLYAHRAMNFGFNIYSTERISHRFASNWRMSDFAAAAICDHIDFVEEDDWIRKHKELMIFSMEEISSKFTGIELYNDITFPALIPCLFLIIPSATCDFDLVATYLHRCSPSIEAKRYYRPLSSHEEAPVAWKLFNKSICLPFHYGMTKELISYQLHELWYAVNVIFV